MGTNLFGSVEEEWGKSNKCVEFLENIFGNMWGNLRNMLGTLLRTLKSKIMEISLKIEDVFGPNI
jgi:hypothetical protein